MKRGVANVIRSIGNRNGWSDDMDDARYMTEALEEAKRAGRKGEVPIGAVVVDEEGNVIGRGHNLRETRQMSTAHAEMVAIEEACKTLKTWRLDGCVLYVTLEPCPMCAGTIIQSRVKRVVYAADDPKNGAHVSKIDVFAAEFTHRVDVVSGVLAQEASKLLREFFHTLRNGRNDV